MTTFGKIIKTTNQCRNHYSTKRMIKILLLIDELYEKGFMLNHHLSDDIEKYGEEVVFSREDHKKQVEDFLKIETNLQSLLKEEQYQIKDLIQNLSQIIKTEEEVD